MDRRLLASFAAVADHLHFGRAAQELKLLPSVVSRDIRLLEDEIGERLFVRTTRHVALTAAGEALAGEAAPLLEAFDAVLARVRGASRLHAPRLRLGAIDSAATGLLPHLMREMKRIAPLLDITIVEDKTVKLLPRILSGALDAAFVRPPPMPVPGIMFEHLLDEAIVVALPAGHALARRDSLTIADIVDLPLIVPSPRTRPHSYRVTFDLFREAGYKPTISQQAEEKHTIVTLVGTNLGGALVPHWTSRMQVSGVVYRPLLSDIGEPVHRLPLALASTPTGDSEHCAMMRTLLRTGLADFIG